MFFFNVAAGKHHDSIACNDEDKPKRDAHVEHFQKTIHGHGNTTAGQDRAEEHVREVVIACGAAEKFLGGFAELCGMISLFPRVPKVVFSVKNIHKPRMARSSRQVAEQLDWHEKCRSLPSRHKPIDRQYSMSQYIVYLLLDCPRRDAGTLL